MSNFLFMSRNSKWKDLRTKSSPVFSSGKLKAMSQLIIGESDSMADYINKHANIPNIETKEICAKYSTNVIARCAFAVDAQSFQDKDAEFRRLGRKMFEIGLTNAFRQFLSWFAPGFLRLLKVTFIDGKITNRLSAIFKEVLNARMENSNNGSDLIDILLDAQKKNKDAGLESLRKYSVLPFLDRICNENYKVEGTDLVIEKGIPVYIPLFGLHYNPEYFPEPEKFIPERFADKSKINKDGLYYIPFGDGPRICIGNRFALLGVKTGIISILSKFKMEVSDQTPIPLQFDTTNIRLASTVGIPMKFVPLLD